MVARTTSARRATCAAISRYQCSVTSTAAARPFGPCRRPASLRHGAERRLSRDGERIESVCAADNRTMPVLIEVNSGREPQKAGAFPEDVEAFARDLGSLAHLRVSSHDDGPGGVHCGGLSPALR